MSKRLTIQLLIFLGIVVVVLLILRGNEDNWLCQNGQWVKHGNPDATKPTIGCGVDNNVNNNATTTPQPEANIAVYGLQAGQKVSLPLAVSGEARVFENVVNIRLKDKDGSILYQGFVNAASPDTGQFGSFSKDIKYLTKTPTGSEVILEVYWASPKDGSDLDLISIPLELDLSNFTSVQLFLGNNKLDPQNTCDKVFSIGRIVPKTQTPAQDALQILLEGANLPDNYFTSINPGVKLNKITIVGGVAKADFDNTLQAGVAGSCRVLAIRAQITQTLKQFPTVKSVIISIDGKTEGILQP